MPEIFPLLFLPDFFVWRLRIIFRTRKSVKAITRLALQDCSFSIESISDELSIVSVIISVGRGALMV